MNLTKYLVNPFNLLCLILHVYDTEAENRTKRREIGEAYDQHLISCEGIASGKLCTHILSSIGYT